MKQLQKTISLDLIFRALSDPTRLRILNLLQEGELCVCDLVCTLEVLQPAISRHLSYLRRTGLVQARKEGLWVHYRLTQPEGAFHDHLRGCLESAPDLWKQLNLDSKRLRTQGRSNCCE